MSGIQMILLGARGAASESYWLAELTGSGVNWVRGIAVDSTGTLYAAGAASGPGATLSPIQKIDTDGVMQWSRSFGNGNSGGPPNGGTLGYAAAVDSSGNSYLAGQIVTNSEAALAKFTSAGNAAWQFEQRGSNPSSDVFYGVATDSSNNVYTTGNAGGSAAGWINKYDSAGTELWRKLVQGGSYVELYAIAVDSSANVYVTGQGGGTASGSATPLFVAKLDTSGTTQWARRFYTSSDNMKGQAVAVDSSGNVYVTGNYFNSSTGQNQMFVMKLNSSGTLQWSRVLTGVAGIGDEGYGIGVNSSGDVYVSGQTRGSAPNYYMLFEVVKFNTSGTLQWQRQISNPTQGLENYCLAVSSTGVPYAAGRGSVPIYAKLPPDGSGSGTYTINGRSYTYEPSSMSVGVYGITQSASPATFNDHTLPSNYVSYSTSPPFTYTFTKASVT